MLITGVFRSLVKCNLFRSMRLCGLVGELPAQSTSLIMEQILFYTDLIKKIHSEFACAYGSL